MSNISKLYTELTSTPSDAPPEEILDTGLLQLKVNWLNSTVTQEVAKSLIKDENDLIDKAVGLACSTTTINAQLLVQILVRVDTIRRLRNDFSDSKNAIAIKPPQ